MVKNLLTNHIGHRRIDLTQIVESLTNRTISVEDDEDDSFFGGLFGTVDDFDTDESQKCTSEDCEMILESVKKYINILLMEVKIIPGLPFGSFLSNFLPANSEFGLGSDFESFAKKGPEYTDLVEEGHFVVKLNEKINWEHQAPIHQFFEVLSHLFGFSANESVSLHDIPQIMATPSYNDYVKPTTSIYLPLNLHADKNFWYTRNKFFGNDDWDLQVKCKLLWLDFIYERYIHTFRSLID